MRNLKKILALVLALVMALSVMSVAGALKLDDYADSESVTPQFQTAVDVATQLGVLNGMNATEYQPKGNLTRAQLATIIYRITTGDVNGTYVSNFVEGVSQFDDVTSAHWAAGYIGFCADAGYLEGWDGSYHPEQAMTGYQALAALLRALGYNEPGEFSGPQWTVRVAQIATQTGVSSGVVTDLNKAITREQTAQFIYNALWTEQVVYTPAFGYNSITTQPRLVQDTFDVQTIKPGVTGSADKWGRPATVWLNSANRVVVEIIDDPVATYTVAVDECDIARDMGLSRDANIENAYIDGELYLDTSVAVTTDGEGNIGVYDTTSYVGAQGRITEVYDMGPAGVRIVEINTYLARVAGVTAATEDKNKHPVAPTITVDVWADNGADGDTTDWRFVVTGATGYAVGDYVLVYVHQPNGYGTTGPTAASVSANDVRKAPVAGTNALYTWTATTHTFGTALSNTSYYDADKFELNDRVFDTWIILTDDYGNVIGLVKPETNYLAIEVISWIDSGILNGYALANVILADGTKVEGVRISTVNGIPAWNQDAQGVIGTAAVSDGYLRNGEYYNHAWTYTVNADGSYSINALPDNYIDDNTADSDIDPDAGNQHDDGSSVYDLGTGSILQGQATIVGSTNNVVATDNTVYLIKNVDGYTYTVYVGKNNVPSGSVAGNICVVTDANGWATLVVTSDFTASGNTFVAYITDNGADYNLSATVRGYNVYRLGETEATVVYGNALTGFTSDGLYTVQVNNNYGIVSVTPIILGVDSALASTVDVGGPLFFDRAAVKTGSLGASLQTQTYTTVGLVPALTDPDRYQVGGTMTDNKDFSLAANMPVIRVTTTDTGLVFLTADAISNVSAGDVVIVGYTTVGTTPRDIHTASVVYVFSGYTAPTYTVTVQENGAALTAASNVTTSTIPATIAHGGTFTFTVTPKDGYKVDSVEQDGTPLTDVDGVYTATAVTANTVINIKTSTIADTQVEIELVLNQNARVTIDGKTYSGEATIALEADQEYTATVQWADNVDASLRDVVFDGAPLAGFSNVYYFTPTTTGEVLTVGVLAGTATTNVSEMLDETDTLDPAGQTVRISGYTIEVVSGYTQASETGTLGGQALNSGYWTSGSKANVIVLYFEGPAGATQGGYKWNGGDPVDWTEANPTLRYVVGYDVGDPDSTIELSWDGWETSVTYTIKYPTV